MRLLTLFCVAIVGGVLACETVESVKSKEEYAVLQVVEYEHRRTPLVRVEIIKKNGYLVAGFRADKRDENVWVLLNAHTGHTTSRCQRNPSKCRNRISTSFGERTAYRRTCLLP